MKKYIIGIVMLVLVLVTVNQVFGAVTQRKATGPTGYVENYTFLNATTTSATSTTQPGDGIFKIAGAKRVTLYFSRAWAVTNTGSSTFSIQVTPDGTNWYNYNTLAQNLATSTYPTTLASVVIEAATSTTIVQMDKLGFDSIRCVVVEATDGAHTCKAVAEF